MPQNSSINGRLEISTECAVNASTSNESTREESWSLPFVKHSSLLRAIEPMGVFQKMPQKPHFNLLDGSKDMYLEGLVIGYMLTFANVVEQTSKLPVSDPTSIFNGMFEALLDLESHGFDVKTVRSCLSEMQSIKEKHEQLQEQLLEYECHILEQTTEKSKITVELDHVVEEIKMLEERKAKLTSAEEEK
ncbi:hypothetical protein KPL71_018359 [Citrus sinensis]|uniref:Uncharacterized protein n=1 Tax=Citrus sinensis TaxID=2711 RepID=A0ACB8JX74_CITSI|nr:hypothetical protein KPL71_018359 [Citrus sinensis]